MVRRADCAARTSLARWTGDWVGEKDEKKEEGICLSSIVVGGWSVGVLSVRSRK